MQTHAKTKRTDHSEGLRIPQHGMGFKLQLRNPADFLAPRELNLLSCRAQGLWLGTQIIVQERTYLRHLRRLQAVLQLLIRSEHQDFQCAHFVLCCRADAGLCTFSLCFEGWCLPSLIRRARVVHCCHPLHVLLSCPLSAHAFFLQV